MQKSADKGSLKSTTKKKTPNIKDKRYQKKEQAIQGAFLKSKGIPTAKSLAEKAGVSRSTMHRHHKTVHHIMPNIEKYMLENFNGYILETKHNENTSTRTLFLCTLAYIYKYRRNFRAIAERGSEKTLENMLGDIMPKVIKDYKIPYRNKDSLRIYRKELTTVLENWIFSNFKRNEFGVLHDLMYLTRTARNRLIILNRNYYPEKSTSSSPAK